MKIICRIKKMEWQSNKVYYVPEPSSLWTCCPSNLFHPHGPSLNIEAINQTLAPGYQEQCSFGPQPDRIQSDLYRPISLFATLHAGNNRVRLTGDTSGDPLKLAMGKGSHFFLLCSPQKPSSGAQRLQLEELRAARGKWIDRRISAGACLIHVRVCQVC